MSLPVTHVVSIDRRKRAASPTLPPDALQFLEAAYRSAPWWRDRWTCPGFRAAAREVMRKQGGLAILGPGVSFEVPPPFVEMFEPIELGLVVGRNTERLRVISGDTSTHWRGWPVVQRIGWGLLGICGLLFCWFFIFYVIPRLPPMGLLVFTISILCTGLIVQLVLMSQRGVGRLFLIPAAIAVVRGPARRGQPARVTVLSRRDSCLVFRYVSTGKSAHLCLELLTHAGRSLRRAVSKDEARSALAAWQSPLTPPPDERLQELVIW